MRFRVILPSTYRSTIGAMSPAATLTPDFDPAAFLPELAEARRLAQTGDWPGLEALFTGLADEQIRSGAALMVAETPGVEQLLQHVVRQLPGNLLAAALLAERHIELAWEARTGARAQYVTQAQWEVFRTHLNQAEQLLIGVTARDPGHALAWSLRIIVAMGLSLGQSEARRRYRNLSRVSPQHVVAQRRMIQQLVPKWGGSWEAAGEFARAGFREAPAGSLAGALIADYHLERWLDLGEPERREYVRRPEVRQELARRPRARSCTLPAGPGTA
jgi:hypothetical protein